MMSLYLNPDTLERIERLIDANFSGRDELYAAAESLEDERRRAVCRQLADHLAGHAAELQQLLAANSRPINEPLDMYTLAESFFTFVRKRGGEAEVLRAAEACERTVRERYDGELQGERDAEVDGVLKRQREDVEFGEQVLTAMSHTPADDGGE